MGAQGASKTGGRKKGAVNKRTRELIAILDEHGYCPIADLIEVAAIARKEYDRVGEIYDAICDQKEKDGVRTPTQDTAPQYLSIIQKSAAEIAPYMFPKRKSVEVSGVDGKDFFQSFTDMVKELVPHDKEKKT